jgi:hypothetical protein
MGQLVTLGYAVFNYEAIICDELQTWESNCGLLHDKMPSSGWNEWETPCSI